MASWIARHPKAGIYVVDQFGHSVVHFGDSWEHKVTLQKILPYDPTARLPACIGGRRRCPPEDCGGVWGYYEMLEILKDPNARDHEHMKEWISEHFDPEVFSPQPVDMVLGKMRW